MKLWQLLLLIIGTSLGASCILFTTVIKINEAQKLEPVPPPIPADEEWSASKDIFPHNGGITGRIITDPYGRRYLAVGNAGVIAIPQPVPPAMEKPCK